MTVIVMLILAGVSLNALVGDNGIITNAQTANIKSGLAALEEFLQQKYVDVYDSVVDNNNKVSILCDIYDYFYDPRDDGYGTVNYIVDSEGHALYLIQKENLPDEIQSSLSGGSCGVGLTGSDRYTAFLSLEDVYGVTTDLKAYYSAGDGIFTGIQTGIDLDNDTTSRVVLSSSNALAALVKGDGTDVTVKDTQSVKNLTINNTSGVSTLREMYTLGSLENLTLENMTLNNLDGIETALKVGYIYFKNTIVGDYSALAKVRNLKYLYFFGIDDAELTKVCNSIKNANFPNLEYFAIVASSENYISLTDWTAFCARARESGTKYITNLEPLSLLESSCVGKIKYVSLHGNEITNTTYTENGTTKTKYALENLRNFSNLYYLRADRNKMTSLKGLENKTDLYYLFVGSNDLGRNEVFDSTVEIQKDDSGNITNNSERGKNVEEDALSALANATNLYYVYFVGNVDLKWVSYLKSDTSIRYLFFGDGTSTTTHCINMVDSEVAAIRNIISGSTKVSYPGKYWLSLLSTEDTNLDVSLSGETVTMSQFEQLGEYTNIKFLNLKNIKIVDGSGNTINDTSTPDINTEATKVLKYLTNLKYLNIDSSSGGSFNKFNDLTFVKGVNLTNSSDDVILKELHCYGTLVSTHRGTEAETTWEEYDEGLKLLNTNRASSEGLYGGSLGALGINETHTDLAKIEAIVQILSNKISQSHFEPTSTTGRTNDE